VSNVVALPLSSDVEAQPDVEWWRTATEGEATVVHLTGKLDIDRAPLLWAKVNGLLDGSPGPKLVLEVSELESMDSACVAILVHLQKHLEKLKTKVELRSANPELRKLYSLHVRKRRHRRKGRTPRGALNQLGQATLNLW